jgi:tetratricopeptide (TPR) repeat protein
LLAVGVAGAALAVGAVHTATLSVVAVTLAAAFVLSSLGVGPTRVRSSAAVILVTALCLTLYTAAQCIPMPMGWLKLIAPYNAEVWSRALSPLGEGAPQWAAVSLDPVATRIEVLKGLTYILALVTALRVGRTKNGVEFLGLTLIFTGVALACAAVLHPAFGATRLFGVYSPGPGLAERHLAPLLNPNNLAGYLNVSLCLALAATLSPNGRVPRPIMGAVVVLLASIQLWVASRGGVATMIIGATIVVATVRLAPSSNRRRTKGMLSLVTAGAAILGGAFVVLGISEEASGELFDANVSKLAMFRNAMHMLPSVPIFGCGRGAFESAYSAFRSDVGYKTYAYPENFIAQWILEWGPPVGAVALGAIASALRPQSVLVRSTTTAPGAWAALVAIAVQNLGDLGSEVPGLALAGVICVAVVTGGVREHRGEFGRLWTVAMPAAGGIVTIAVVALCIRGEPGELSADRSALYEAASNRIAAGPMRDLARAAMLRHPAEAYVPFIAALRAWSVGDENPIPWVGATLERARVYGPAHLVLARTLGTRSRAQTRLEYRVAMEQAPELVPIVMTEAPRFVSGHYDAMELVPEGIERSTVLELLSTSVAARLPATRVVLDNERLARTPMAPEPILRLATDAVEDLEAGEAAPWCADAYSAACKRIADERVARALRVASQECPAYVLAARVRVVEGETQAAVRELDAAADHVSDRVKCLQEMALIAKRGGDRVHFQEALKKVAASGCASDVECARNLVWVAQQEEMAGNIRSALVFRKRAYERAPDDDALLASIAAQAADLGLHAEAAEDYERLARRHPQAEAWQRALRNERAEAAKGGGTL